MLKLGQRAIYPKKKVKEVPLFFLDTYFQKGKDRWKDHVKVKPAVRQHVRFKKFNLLSDAPLDMFDIIFLRNVMIYFDPPTGQKVVTSLCRALNPGGYFFVGMSENLHGFGHSLKMVTPSGYQKK